MHEAPPKTIAYDRDFGNQPYPPKFDPTRYPVGTIVRVTARRTRLTATYESNGHCWRRTDGNVAPRPKDG